MIERTALQELENWKNSEYRKPLILRGARQVGRCKVGYNHRKKHPRHLAWSHWRTDYRSGTFNSK